MNEIKNFVTEKQTPTPKGTVEIITLVREDFENRTEFGRKKYGEVLKAENGRDPLIDAYQEAIDLVMYLRQMLYEKYKK